MSITKLLLIMLVSILSFGVTFGVVWFTQNSKQPQTDVASPQQASIGNTNLTNVEQNLLSDDFIKPTKSLPEKRLQNLIEDVRSQIVEYKNREKQLDAYENRLEMTKAELADELNKLTELKKELSQSIISLKEQQERLDSKIMQISSTETQRLQQLAAVYDKMEETASSKILINMISNNQLDDAAKILFYMSDRSAAKVLAQISNVEPTISRVLCTKLKYIKEEGK